MDVRHANNVLAMMSEVYFPPCNSVKCIVSVRGSTICAKLRYMLRCVAYIKVRSAALF